MFVPGNNLAKAAVFLILLIVGINMTFQIKVRVENQIKLWNEKNVRIAEVENKKNMEALNAAH